MTEWIKVSDKLPETDVLCLVMHKNRPFDLFKAIYYARHNEFVWDNPDLREKPLISCTHYLIIPEFKG